MDSASKNETRWIKFGQPTNIFFVGKDTLGVSQSFHILFLNYKKKENGSSQFITYEVNEDDDGIACVAGHERLSMFATAMTKSSIQLFSYPTFSQITTLRDKSERRYQALTFSDGEIIMSLSSGPDYALTIWNWLSGKKLTTVPTNTTSLDQKLMCFCSSPILISQTSEEMNELQIWEVSPCCNTCYVVSKSIDMPNAKYYSSCWSSDGILWVIDDSGAIYHIDAVTCKPILFLLQGKTFDLKYIKPCIGCFKSNLIVTTANGTVNMYKKCNGKWSPNSETFGMKTSLLQLNNSSDWNTLLGWSCMGNILKIEFSDISVDDQTLTASILINFGISIFDICVINPQQKYFASISNKGLFQVWEADSGKLVSTFSVDGKCLVEHPYLPIAAVGSDCGSIHFFNISDVTTPRTLCSFLLDNFIIEKILFDVSGIYTVAAGLHVGKFFILQMSPHSETFYQVTHHLDLERQVLSTGIVSSASEFFIINLFPLPQLQHFNEKNIKCLKEDIIKTEIYGIDAGINHEDTATPSQELVFYRGVRHKSTDLGNGNELLHHATLQLKVSLAEDKLKKYKVDEKPYYSNFNVIGGPLLKDSVFYIIPTYSQKILIFEINLEELKKADRVKLSRVINTGHQIQCNGKVKKSIQIGSNTKSESKMMTFGADGLVFIHHHNMKTGHEQQVTALRSHHYLCGGVRRAILTSPRRYLLSLGWDGCIVSKRIKISNHKICATAADEAETNTEHASVIHILKKLPQKQISTPGSLKSWIELKTEEEIRKKREESEEEKISIHKEFEAMKSEFIAEIEKNISSTKDVMLSLTEFDMNRKLREKKIQKTEIKRQEEELKIINIIRINKSRAEKIRKECWNQMDVNGKCIKTINGNLEVENYPLLQEKVINEESIGEVIERRVMEIEITISKLFTPWIPESQSYTQRLLQQGLQTAAQSRFSVKMNKTTCLYMMMVLEAVDAVGERPTTENESDFRWSGSISHKFVNVPECLHWQQLELLTFNSSRNETIILEVGVLFPQYLLAELPVESANVKTL